MNNISKHSWLLILTLIIAGFLRLYHITTVPPGLYPDEAMNGNNALQAISTGDFKTFYPENNGREGLFINIQALFLKFFGVNSPSQVLPGKTWEGEPFSISGGENWEGKPWVLRLPSNIFGILTILGIYFLAKELFSARVGLLSAFFLATNFWHINFSHIGFRAIMAPAFLTWSVFLLLKALNQVKNVYQVSSIKYQVNDWIKNFILPILAGVIYGLGFYSYIAYRVTPVLIIFVVLFYWFKNNYSLVRKKILVSCLLFLVSSFIVALPIGIYYLQNPADFMGRTTQVSVFSSAFPLNDLAVNTIKTLGMFNFAGDWNWRHNYSGSPELFWPVGILFLIGIIFSIKNIVRSSGFGVRNDYKFGFWILFLWFFLAMLPVVISNEGIPHALRSILMIPPVIILAGIGGVAAYDFLKKYITSFWLPLATTAFLAILVFQGYYSYFVAWAKNPNVPGAFAADYVELGRKLNSLPASLPKYVVVEAGGGLVNNIPMPAQTVMFITGTYLPEGQKAKNIRYVLPDEEKNIPAGAEIFFVR